MIAELCARFDVGERVRAAALRAERRVADLRYPAQEAVAANVLRAFADEGINDGDLAGSNGYGYGDAARERYESLLARLFGAERALARLSLVSGTHAIVAALAACAPPGTRLLSVSGRPYDTLRHAICDAPDSLVALGTHYHEIALAGGDVDLDAVLSALRGRQCAAVFLQRSRGYAARPSLSIAQCERAMRL